VTDETEETIRNAIGKLDNSYAIAIHDFINSKL